MVRFTNSRLILGISIALTAHSPVLFAETAQQPGQQPAVESQPQLNREVLERTSAAFNAVAKKVSPAVVSISAVKAPDPTQAAADMPIPMPGMPAMPEGHPFGGGEGSGRSFGIGSGIVIRQDGVILTNHHVVENAEKVTVAFGEDRKYQARVVGSDPSTDLAVLKINEDVKGLPVAKFGNSDQVQVGDWAVAIGSPFGLTHSVTSGIVSAVGRANMGVYDTEDFIQTDAAINPGNSGGPLLNLDGQVIGVNAAIFSESGGFIGIGFSIPSNMAQRIATELLAHGRIKRGWIGVVAQDLDKDLASYFKVPGATGALISDVAPDGPAGKGAIKSGDVITRYANQPVKDSEHLKTLVSKTPAGSKVPVQVIRKGKSRDITLTIQEKKNPNQLPQVQKAGRVAKDGEQGNLGLAIQDIPAEFAPLLGLSPKDGALIVDVDPGSTAFDAGLTPGDVILKANDASIRDANDFVKFSKGLKRNEPAVLYVQRGPEEKVFVPLKRG